MLRVLLLAGLAASLAPGFALAQATAGFGDPGPGPSIDMRDREAEVQDRILDAIARHRLDNHGARRLLRQLDDVRRFDQIYRDAEDRMTPDQTRDLEVRLDAVRAGLDSALAENPQATQRAGNAQAQGPR